MLHHEILPLELIERIILEIDTLATIPRFIRQLWYYNVTLDTLLKLLVKHELDNLDRGYYKIYVNFDSKKYTPSDEFLFINYKTIPRMNLKSDVFKSVFPFFQLWYGYETRSKLNFYLNLLPYCFQKNKYGIHEVSEKWNHKLTAVDLKFVDEFLKSSIYRVVSKNEFENSLKKLTRAKLIFEINSFYSFSLIGEYQEWQPNELDITIKRCFVRDSFIVSTIKLFPFKSLRVFKFKYNSCESYLSPHVELGPLLGNAIEEVTIIMMYLNIKVLLRGFNDRQLSYFRIDSNLVSYGSLNSKKRAQIREMINSKTRNGNYEMNIIDW
ncbi:uncharacterized protein KGF55_002783 [Candida pseudojiufengensis]|uniref:uncharacterized protein n=1 Tax=Candida pseudojiufengensis TaxID=497109 RepID=UPI002225A3AE|nr:uncharacterized protein KGF55_002783 [Candida pseudojiufengensis]KAI5962991.1 hypothetical protein KGF55_002783 [Candida pseudojiufengensis]